MLQILEEWILHSSLVNYSRDSCNGWEFRLSRRWVHVNLTEFVVLSNFKPREHMYKKSNWRYRSLRKIPYPDKVIFRWILGWKCGRILCMIIRDHHTSLLLSSESKGVPSWKGTFNSCNDLWTWTFRTKWRVLSLTSSLPQVMYWIKQLKKLREYWIYNFKLSTHNPFFTYPYQFNSKILSLRLNLISR